MPTWLIGIYVAFSAVIAWRAAGVAIHGRDAAQRKDAFKVFTLVWGGGTVSSGVIVGVTKLHEAGLLS